MVSDVFIGRQGQGAYYETPRSVHFVREEWRMISNAEIDVLGRHHKGFKRCLGSIVRVLVW